MRRRVFIPAVLAIAAGAAALLGACKATDLAGDKGAGSKVGVKVGEKPSVSAPPSGTTEIHADGVRRVTAAEVQKMLEDGTAVVYDTRAKMAYDAEHIAGALSMPFEEVANRAGELPKGKTLVFYCT